MHVYRELKNIKLIECLQQREKKSFLFVEGNSIWCNNLKTQIPDFSFERIGCLFSMTYIVFTVCL